MSDRGTATEDAPDELLGRVVNNKYKVLSLIGRGGMGAVYRAEQLPLGRVVAFKVLRNLGSSSQSHDPAFQKRFLLEAQLCAKLSHPNIVTIHDYGRIEDVEGDAFFITMEFLQGPTLHQRLRQRGGRLDPEEACALVAGVSRGLREAHKYGVVHRDLKPGNILLVEDEEHGERPKIVDFGLVKQVGGDDDREDLTQQGAFLGSPKYMSPEQVEGAGVDHRSDLYALGAIFYQCLAGKVPFDKGSTMQTLLAHVSDAVPSFEERAPEVQVPVVLANLVYRMLSKNPADRPASASAVLEELRTVREVLGYRSVHGTSTGLHVAAGALVDGPSASGSVPSVSSTSGFRPVSPVAPAPVPSTSIPAPAPTPVEEPRKRSLVVPLLLLVVLLLCGLLGFVLLPRGNAPRGGVAPPAVLIPATPMPPVPVAPPSGEPAAPPPATAAPTPAAAPPQPLANAPPPEPSSPATRRAPPPAPVRHPTAPVAASAAPTPPAPAPPATPAEEPGFLTLDTTPYSVVTLEGRNLGTTPLVHVRLPAGVHVLTLSNPEEHLTMTYRVTIRPGETLTRRLGLQ